MRRKVFLAMLLLVSFLCGCGKLSADEPETVTENDKEELSAETEASAGTEAVEPGILVETEEASDESEEGIFFFENSWS